MSRDGDTEMADASLLLAEQADALWVQKLRILEGASTTAASFEFLQEDHTLGNALRHIIMKNPDVEFCGYSIPHPSEARMNLRIQTYQDTGVNVLDVLEKGLNDLIEVCDVVENKFVERRDEFKANGNR